MILSKNLAQPEVTDVVDVRTMKLRRLFRSKRFIAALTIALAALSAAIWWTLDVYLKPSRDQRKVDEAVVLLEINPSMKQWLLKTSDWPEERKLITLAEVFREKDFGVPAELGIKASRAALDLAIHKGSLEARLELGKALRDGNFGAKNAEAALTQFKSALTEIQPGISVSDQDALYVYSLILKEGLGVEASSQKALELLKKVAMSRDYVTMEKMVRRPALLGNDFELVKAMVLRLLETGRTDSYVWGVSACSEQFSDPVGHSEKFMVALRAGNRVVFTSLMNEAVARLELRKKCKLQTLRLAAEKGNEDARVDLARYVDDDTTIPNKSMAANSAITQQVSPVNQLGNYKPQPNPQQQNTAPDPEAQSNTGYLGSTKQLAKGGLSTFKIDNSKGGGDAVVRLYRDGKTPAARSMFVKNGETFTAEAVAPGAYRLRYRYIGSEDTFEADETFTLAESKTETGTRFSRMTVTLYKVANGNMTVKKVDPTNF
jgi:hypothetical protein